MSVRLNGRSVFALLLLMSAYGPLAAGPPTAAGERSFCVRDFGAVPDGRTESGAAIRAAIAAALAAGTSESPAEVVFEAGAYRVCPGNPRGYCFPISEARSRNRSSTGAHSARSNNEQGA